MLAVHPTGIGCGEDASNTSVLGDDGAPDVMRGHVLQDNVQGRAGIDTVGLGHIHVTHEELVERRQSERWIEGSFEIPVCQDAHERMFPEHRQVPDVVLHHHGARMAQRVVGVDCMWKWGHG